MIKNPKRFLFDKVDPNMDYCSLDDSFEQMYLEGIKEHIELYTSAICYTDNSSKRLIIARPKNSLGSGVLDLLDFIEENAKNKVLIACWHYKRYANQLKKRLNNIEFVTHKMRIKRNYSSFKRTLFHDAHYQAKGTTLRLRSLFGHSRSYLKHRELMEEAIKKGDDKFQFSLEILLRGFY
ncbi:MAG: hypothetical protein U9Q69_00325 [Nanoarchaeota archaeon]|nr:hypothetical protein [Nanoarchaeota archaeon]